MKLAEVKVGSLYYTYIGQELAPVIVMQQTIDHWSKRKAFYVKRSDEREWLPKPRTAAALRAKQIKEY